jgi:hypothetical protein
MIRTGFLHRWSRFWWFFHRERYQRIRSTDYDSIYDLQTAASQFPWDESGRSSIFQIIRNPKEVEFASRYRQGSTGNEVAFALYLSDRIQNLVQRGILPNHQSYFMFLVWIDSAGHLRSTGICLFHMEHNVFWDCCLRWPVPFSVPHLRSPEEIAVWFARRCGGTPLAYVRSTPDLETNESSRVWFRNYRH